MKTFLTALVVAAILLMATSISWGGPKSEPVPVVGGATGATWEGATWE